MDIIKKKDIDFDSLFKLYSICNSESKLFYDDNYVYKMFNDTAKFIYLLRKKIKLEMLNDGPLIDSAILANGLIMDNKKLSGYRMERICNATPICDFSCRCTSINIFFKLMYNVSLSLRNIHDDPRNIVIGDLSVSNIVFDENMKHYFVDFDSVKIGVLPPDRIPYSLKKYAEYKDVRKYTIDKSTDRLCLILAILFIVFNESIEYTSMYEYDKMAEMVDTLKNMREIVLELKKCNTVIPDLPYFDELISPSIFQSKKKTR